MYQLWFYSFIFTFILTMSTGQNGSSNQQSMFGNGFMSHKSSSGKVHSMGSNESGSFMTNMDSKGNGQSMGTDDSGSSFMSNGKSSVSRVDEMTTDQPGEQTTDLPDVETSTDQQFFSNASHGHSHHRTGDVVVVSGGNGADGADASEGGADGADGSIQVQASKNKRRH